MNKFYFIFFFVLFLSGCSGDSIEKFAFKKIIQYTLVDICSENDTACIQAVETQLDECMNTIDWKPLGDSFQDEEVIEEIISTIAFCIVDNDGDSYFSSKQ